MDCPYYEISLPMPPSVNNMHTVGRGFYNKKTRKYERVQTRSPDYKDWIEFAGVCYRNKYKGGVFKLEGRLRADYIFCWHEKDFGRNSSDISNREKCLSDFLENKLYENDNQIDEQHHYRRIVKDGQSRVMVRIYAIDDRRFLDPDLIWDKKTGS